MIAYDKLTDEALRSVGRVLLHCCCGPCATAVVERILPLATPVLYYYNPNIMPESEYDKRLGELEKVAAHFSVELIAEPYDAGEFLAAVRGLEREKEGGARCPVCFGLRLSATAKRARREGIEAICTTLTVSPHKDAIAVNAAGEKAAYEGGVRWIYSDFKKRDGYRRSIVLSRELGLYRQNYCGCSFAAERE